MCNICSQSAICLRTALRGVCHSTLPPFKLKLVANTQLSKIINKSRLMSHAILHNKLQELSHSGLFCSPFPANIHNTAVALRKHV